MPKDLKDIFKDQPFLVSVSLLAAAIAGWRDWAWWAILIALLVGAVAGAAIDDAAKKNKK